MTAEELRTRHADVDIGFFVLLGIIVSISFLRPGVGAELCNEVINLVTPTKHV